MKKEWKIRQEIYHRLNPVHSDDLKKVKIVICNDNKIVDYAVEYFSNNNLGWIYPAKSYVVAICYSLWLKEIWNGNVLDYLDDPDLLYGNDPYFVRYSNKKEVYDSIINSIGWKFNSKLGVIPDIRKYFEEEFMLND